MKNILKYCIVGVALYFGINWVADNPKMMKVLRAKMNAAVSDGIEQLKEVASEIEQSA